MILVTYLGPDAGGWSRDCLHADSFSVEDGMVQFWREGSAKVFYAIPEHRIVKIERKDEAETEVEAEPVGVS